MNVRWQIRAVVLALCALVGGALFADASAQAALPEGREYEMVSPPDKNGSRILNQDTQSSVSGGGVLFASQGAFAGVQAGDQVNAYVASRSAADWSTVGVQPPLESGGELFPQSGNVLFLSADLHKEIVQVQEPSLVPGAPEGVPNLYVRDNITGTYQLITTVAPDPVPGDYAERLTFADASADLSHVLFQARGALTPGAPSGVVNLYEWHDGHLSLVGTPTPAEGGTLAGNGAGSSNGRFHTQYAISRDGARVFFTANPLDYNPGFNEGFGGQLYMKDGGTTIHVSASQSSSPEPDPEGTHFMTAAADGSKVLFRSSNRLTDDANVTLPELADTRGDLYSYDVGSGKLTDLTGSSPDPIGADVSNVLAATEDLSYIYFDASGQLVPGKGASGDANVYLWHEGTISYVGALSGLPPGEGGYSLVDSGQMTPDGKTFAFTSTKKLTAFDNAEVSEVYIYDAETGNIACASCRAGALGGAGFQGGSDTVSLGGRFVHVTRSVSVDGTVYFATDSALVPEDHNGEQDVYQWKDGVVSLISTGQSDEPSRLGDVSPDGKDVFFYTTQSLVPGDWDGVEDLYDARADGGFPSAPPTPACAADECRPAPSPPPVFGSPASVSLSGGGNAQAPASHPVVKVKAKPKLKKKHKQKVKKRGKRTKGSKVNKSLSVGTRR